MKDNFNDYNNLSADEYDELMKKELENEDEKAVEVKKKNIQNKKDKIHKKGEGKSLSLKVDDKSPSELMTFLREKLKDKSRTTIKSYLTHRQISVNDIPTTQFNHKLVAGDTVSLNFGLTKDTFKSPFLRIVYEDDYVIVIDKKNGLLSMATDRERQKTAYYILSEYLKKQDKNNRIFIVHRLDRETSGLLIFAKSMEVQHAFQYNWNETILERKYVAVIEGILEKDSGEIKSYLAENKAYKVYSTKNEAEGELAITNYKVLKRGKENTLIELELMTGKKNQIRVHMSDIGHPICGDRKYDGHESPIGRLALHASRVRFVHPMTNKEMTFDIGVPVTFNHALSGKKYQNFH